MSGRHKVLSQKWKITLESAKLVGGDNGTPMEGNQDGSVLSISALKANEKKLAVIMSEI